MNLRFGCVHPSRVQAVRGPIKVPTLLAEDPVVPGETGNLTRNRAVEQMGDPGVRRDDGVP